MISRKIDRRQFLESGLAAAALAAAGRLPLLAADTESGSGIDASAGPHAVKPVRSLLPRFSPADPRTEQGHYALTYNIIHWSGATSAVALPPNPVIGSITIKRTPARDSVLYEVNQQTRIGGVNNMIEAQITCRTDDLNSLKSWNVRFYHDNQARQTDPLSLIQEKGTCRNGKISVGSRDSKYGFAAKRPVLTQWTLLNYLIHRATPATRVDFDLLQDLSLFKPAQNLFYDGPVCLKLKGDETVTLHSYAQIGEGILPIHYLLDDHRRPQLVTAGLISWALAG